VCRVRHPLDTISDDCTSMANFEDACSDYLVEALATIEKIGCAVILPILASHLEHQSADSLRRLLGSVQNISNSKPTETLYCIMGTKQLNRAKASSKFIVGKPLNKPLTNNAEALGHLTKWIRDRFPKTRGKFHCTIASRMNRVHIVLRSGNSGVTKHFMTSPFSAISNSTDQSALTPLLLRVRN